MKKDYALHTLGSDEFEDLVAKVCVTWMGQGVVPFSLGKDGGRDARFEGRAEQFPSEAEPWKGKIVIQAKHTTAADASCSDAAFKKKFFKEELPKIKKLVKERLLDYYVLFSNRKLTGGADKEFLKRIISAGAKGAAVIGRERIVLKLDSNPALVAQLPAIRLNMAPLRFNSADLAALIPEVHSAVTKAASKNFDSAHDFTFLKKGSKKNRINGLTPEYYDYMQQASFPAFPAIKKFLENVRNRDMVDLYHDTADELKQQIILSRDQFKTFDEVIAGARDIVVQENPSLRGKKRLVNTLLHYMYCDCDIGQHA